MMNAIELNKYILAAKNSKNFTQEELYKNAAAARDAAADATDAAEAAAAIARAANAVARAAVARDAGATTAADDDDATAKYWTAEYFEITSEDESLYDAEIKRINSAQKDK